MRVVCPHCMSVNNVPKKESYQKANCGRCKESLLFTKPIDLFMENFDEVIINSDIPVVVDFWAPWCGPCKVMVPEFTKTAGYFPLKALFAKVNTQDEQKLAQRFDVRSIPTLMVFQDGKEVYRMSGALKEASIKSLVESFIS